VTEAITTAPKVFVCHAHADRAKAESVATALREQGVDAWLDKWEIQPGDSLIQKIFEEGLRDCKVFLIMLSNASVQSAWVREELDIAIIRRIEGATRVIPVLLEQCEVPIALRSMLWLDMTANQDVVRRIRDVAFGIRETPPIGPPPSQLKFTVPGLSKLATQVAVHLSASLDSPTGSPSAFQGSQLQASLAMQPDDLNDAVEELQKKGLVSVRKYLGTSPFHFGLVEPTYALAHQLRNTPALTYDPEQDAKLVANAIVNERVADGARIATLTGLSPSRINNAINYLEDYGLIRVLRAHGTSPFGFRQTEATGSTRQFVSNNQ
jgi:DNA-binding MarR family transcriptional regulator